MGDLSARDYERILDLTTAILESNQTRLPWPLVRDELSKAIPTSRIVLFWSQGWIDSPPDDFPVPYPRANSAPPADSPAATADRCLARHPLVRYYQATADPIPRTFDGLRGRWPDERTRHIVNSYLGADSHLLVPLPAPSGESHVILMGSGDDGFSVRDRRFAARLAPLLAGVVNQQRQLLRQHARPFPDAGWPDLAPRQSSDGLTPREQAVLVLLADGLTANAIGHRLGISPRTAHKHLENLYRKLGTNDRLTTILHAQTRGLLLPHRPRLSGSVHAGAQ